MNKGAQMDRPAKTRRRFIKPLLFLVCLVVLAIGLAVGMNQLEQPSAEVMQQAREGTKAMTTADEMLERLKAENRSAAERIERDKWESGRALREANLAIPETDPKSAESSAP
jgi:hypothetical protein